MKFEIDNKVYTSSNEYIDSFSVNSALKKYNVKFFKEESGILSLKNGFDINNDFLLIDKKVFGIYNNYFNSIPNDRIFKVEAVEENKTLDQCIAIMESLSKLGFTKKGILKVVGGGILQDIAALVGAMYKRGINWDLYPSTLLSMSDSCIGSKSSINFYGYKNQLGLFSAPDNIYIDTFFLRSLEPRELYSGLGEILKLHLIGGSIAMKEYQTLVENGTVKSWDSYRKLIFTSLSVKKPVIEDDEFDLSYRRSLNYGHTFGHALEAITNYLIPHGQAIAIGMLIANKVSNNENKEISNYLRSIIPLEQLNVIQDINIKSLYEIVKSDKKVVGEFLNFVSLKDIGNVEIKPIKLDDKFLKETEEAFNDLFE